MSLVALLAVTIPQILNYVYAADIPIGILSYILVVLTGALSTWVASLGYGAAGGALTGLVIALGGGLAFVFTRQPEVGPALKMLLATTVIATVLGSVLGLVGGFPVWLWKLRKRMAADAR